MSGLIVEILVDAVWWN